MNQAVQAMLQDASVVNATVFCTAAMCGQLLHMVKKWADGYERVLSNPRATVGALIGNISGMVGFVSTGALDEITKVGTVIALGIFMGLSADSVLNKGQQRVWTDDERAAAKEKP